MQPVKLNYKIYQGSTFNEVLRWESSTKVYKTISSITKTAPVVITTTEPHEVPDGWRVKITNVLGMKEINSDTNYNVVSNTTASTLEINDINAVGFTAFTGGGVLEYNKPTDLTGFTARMQIREKITSAEVILSLTTENSGIVINNTTKTITLNISATDTASLNFTTAVYSLELVSPTGVVTPFINGNISLVQEVTR